MRPLQLPPLDTNLSTSSLATTPSASSPPSSTAAPLLPRSTSPPSSSDRPRRRRVSFCPLALLIDVAAEGEPEPALVKAAQEQLGKRKVALHAYSFEAPQIGDVAGKAWHSVLNGFTASLEPFLSGGGGGGGSACSRSGGRAREHSPERLSGSGGGRRRASSLGSLRSASPGRSSTADDCDDPFFTPNPTTRLTVKLPALRRQCLRSLSTSPTRSILRRCAANISLDAACRSPSHPPALVDDPSAPFPPLSPTSSAPPPIASTHADDPASHSALVPLAPCCASCERATHYGLLPDGTGTPYGATYRERWSAGAKKKRAEERKEREAREKNAGEAPEAAASAAAATTADKLAAAVARRAADKGARDESEEEKEAEEAEEEARASRLGQLAAKGGVDELARERGRRGTPDTPARGGEGGEVDQDSEPATPVEPRERETTTGPGAADEPPRALDDVQRLPTAADSVKAPEPAPSSSAGEPPRDAPLALACPPSRPPLDSTASAPAALPTHDDAPALPVLSRTTSPATTGSSAPVAAGADCAPVRPTNKRRLSTATASLSRFAAAFGQGLLHNSSSAGAAGGAGVRA
ncbi:hypothetical protein JCM3775_003279 [Rhodotorula graminis]|uniref:Uncharacterized protein n=1 Tax=Rhodotorula graminis (strain WP1) TaxID=578459 RepID=A0A0P9IVL3_RHOGW|nr:uncharacterized protein RHOBADRAFT_45696 [Rhodotorula graminis WP1]KPV73740.1 hypothetical protein RHOBADRAFT_45696 [Rhodotorula graminis WP1]